jgi:hypothetical protein
LIDTEYSSGEYMNRLRRHNSGNTVHGLFDLLIIVALEYHPEWSPPEKPNWCVFRGTPPIIRHVTDVNESFRTMGISTPEELLKNICFIQNNLELMDRPKIPFKEFVLMHHTLVDYFMLHGGRPHIVDAIVAPQAQTQAQAQVQGNIVVASNSPSASTNSEISCYATASSKKEIQTYGSVIVERHVI